MTRDRIWTHFIRAWRGTRDQLAALARSAVTIALGLAPFVALGLIAGLPVAAAAYFALAAVAGVVFALSEWRPW